MTQTGAVHEDYWAPPSASSETWATPEADEPFAGPGSGTGLPLGPVLALVLVTSVLAGGIGAAVGIRSARDGAPSAASLRDPSATLGSPSSRRAASAMLGSSRAS